MTKIGTANLSIWENELKSQGVNTEQLDLEKTIDLFAPNTRTDTKNRITSFMNEDGKRVYLQFNDELIFNSVMNLDRVMNGELDPILDALINEDLKLKLAGEGL